MTSWRIIEGDCRDRLAELPAGSVQTCVTSPPFFGLRDYGTATWEGGDADCDHGTARRPSDCPCGARRVDKQIGLEPTPSCGRQGMFRLRSDLTEDQRRYVVQRLLGEEPRDV